MLFEKRCWTYETSVLLNTSIPNELPYNDFFEYYAPDFELHLTPSSAENQNSQESLQEITSRVLQNLKYLEGAPSVQMHPIPPDWVISRAEPQVCMYVCMCVCDENWLGHVDYMDWILLSIYLLFIEIFMCQ